MPDHLRSESNVEVSQDNRTDIRRETHEIGGNCGRLSPLQARPHIARLRHRLLFRHLTIAENHIDAALIQETGDDLPRARFAAPERATGLAKRLKKIHDNVSEFLATEIGDRFQFRGDLGERGIVQLFDNWLCRLLSHHGDHDGCAARRRNRL